MPPRKKRAPSRNPAKPPIGKGIARSAALVIRMVNACEEAMLLHMSKDNICRLLGEIAHDDMPPNQRPPVPSRTADDYIARVRKRWEADQTQTSREIKRQAVLRQFSHIRRAVQQKNLAAIARHEKLLNDIQGTFAPLKVEASGPGGTPLTPRTESDVLGELKKLVERVAGAPGEPKAP